MVAAGRSIVARAAGRSIPVRLIGGVAIWIRGSPAARNLLGRDYPDIDLVAHKRQSRALRALLEETGFVPERVFNATHGARRLLYHDPGGWQVDVFLDTFEMSHTLDLGARLEAEPETLAAAELLLTKLQVAEINVKDLSDAAMLLWDHEPAAADGPGLLNVARMAATCGADWGLYTTVTDNLGACGDLLPSLVAAGPERDRIGGRIGEVARALAAAPKTMGWQLRAKVGRRKRWYQLPEEVTR
jgi:8-oxo-dGTP pyrophosphatase MutT (NUDIX family)